MKNKTDKYVRIPGGEKNKKSGTKWTKKELLEVYCLYKKLNGKGIHERNPEIQNLAIKLDRTVRSTEAQLIMYRSLQKGGDYGHKNMNKLCKEIWIEMEENNFENDEFMFPGALLEWSGHKKGGVKKPFDLESGRPNGRVIKTQLTKKIDSWVENINKKRTPKVILLIGGPGNGKTDALEYLISKIDHNYSSNYFSKVAELIQTGDSIPRKVSIDVNGFDNFSKIEIVQDASTGSDSKSSQLCLLEDIESTIKGESVYIACINRGILAETLTLASDSNSKAFSILNQITKALTQTISPIKLWPLELKDGKESNIGVWPMDIESLVKLDSKDYSPAKDILNDALDDKNWNCKSCEHQKLCPIFNNRKSLQKESEINALIKILSDFEVISNKRWSFREVFSLIPYLIVGSEDDFGKDSPCVWVDKQISRVVSGDIRNEILGSLNLFEHLYQTRLFNLWPDFNFIARQRKGEYKDLLSNSDHLKIFFNYFSFQRQKRQVKPDIAKLIDSSFFEKMDPSGISNKELDFKQGKWTLDMIEAEFSYSVSTALKRLGRFLNPLEKHVLELLSRLEKNLDDRLRLELANTNSKIDELIGVIRNMASRFYKRSVLTAKGISKDSIFIEEFLELNSDNDTGGKKLKKTRKLFSDLIHDGKELALSVNLSFGQPNPDVNNNVILKVSGIKVKSFYTKDEYQDVPRNGMAFFKIESKIPYNIPVTYQLFKALKMIQKDVREASLPEEVIAMLDNIKSRLSGVIVRESDKLIDSTLTIGKPLRRYTLSEVEDDYLELEIEEKDI